MDKHKTCIKIWCGFFCNEAGLDNAIELIKKRGYKIVKLHDYLAWRL